MLFCIMVVPMYIPTVSAERYSFLHILSSIYYFWTFDDNHSDWCEVISHCSFDFHFANIFKSRDITLPTNVRLVKAMVFPVVMYGCESWTVKKAEL